MNVKGSCYPYELAVKFLIFHLYNYLILIFFFFKYSEKNFMETNYELNS